MKLIYDRVQGAKKFPLDVLLRALRETMPALATKRFEIRKIGGIGAPIWAYEARIDGGEVVFALLKDLERIAEEPSCSIDELMSTAEGAVLGVGDSSFMFFQCADKKLEDEVSLRFKSVESVPDRLDWYASQQ